MTSESLTHVIIWEYIPGQGYHLQTKFLLQESLGNALQGYQLSPQSSIILFHNRLEVQHLEGPRTNSQEGLQYCHDFHCFSSFSTLSPRGSHSFRSTMTCFSYPYLILSFFSYLIFSGHMIKMEKLSLLHSTIYNSGLWYQGPVGVYSPLVKTSPLFNISQFLPRASRTSTVASLR